MKIKLTDITEDERAYTGDLDPALFELDDDGDMVAKGPLHYEIHVCVVSEMLIARGRLEAPFSFRCSRCGNLYDEKVSDLDYSVALDLDLERVKAVAEEDDADHTENDRDGVLRYVEKGIEFVDLTPDLRESMILRFPGYPICAETCEGRCPKCGQNLNTDVCSCEPEPADDRWGKLDHLQVKQRK